MNRIISRRVLGLVLGMLALLPLQGPPTPASFWVGVDQYQMTVVPSRAGLANISVELYPTDAAFQLVLYQNDPAADTPITRRFPAFPGERYAIAEYTLNAEATQFVLATRTVGRLPQRYQSFVPLAEAAERIVIPPLWDLGRPLQGELHVEFTGDGYVYLAPSADQERISITVHAAPPTAPCFALHLYDDGGASYFSQVRSGCRTLFLPWAQQR